MDDMNMDPVMGEEPMEEGAVAPEGMGGEVEGLDAPAVDGVNVVEGMEMDVEGEENMDGGMDA